MINWKTLLCVFSLSLSTYVYAEVASWQIVPAESNITFTATQNDAPVSGEFKKFTGEIYFDPAQLAASKVKITVDMRSVSASYAELVDTLKTADWFNVALYPQAVFVANQFTKTGDKTYQAKGTLTIRDKTQPLTVHFTEEEFTNSEAKVKGSTTIQRNAFGVGQGEWKSTEEVKDEVKVDFVVYARR